MVHDDQESVSSLNSSLPSSLVLNYTEKCPCTEKCPFKCHSITTYCRTYKMTGLLQ